MKSVLLSIVAALAVAPLAWADDVTVKLSDVHLCCDSCVKSVDKAVATVDGAKDTCDKTAKEIVITAPDKATAQKAVDALTKAGFFGTCTDPDIKVNASTGAKGDKVQTLKVEGIHMCCPKCVKGLNAAKTDIRYGRMKIRAMIRITR